MPQFILLLALCASAFQYFAGIAPGRAVIQILICAALILAIEFYKAPQLPEELPDYDEDYDDDDTNETQAPTLSELIRKPPAREDAPTQKILIKPRLPRPRPSFPTPEELDTYDPIALALARSIENADSETYVLSIRPVGHARWDRTHYPGSPTAAHTAYEHALLRSRDGTLIVLSEPNDPLPN